MVDGVEVIELADDTVASPENVEIVRRRLRSILRTYRLGAKLTQKEAAGKLGISESKLLRVEQGTQSVQPSDMRAMLQLYRETDLTKVENLVEQAIRAQREKGYENYADIASPAYQELMGLEAAADAIFKHEPSMVPGLFQTEEYARHLSTAVSPKPEKVERQVDLRMLRQQKLGLGTKVHPELNFILGEAALLRRVGSLPVMDAQLDHLLELAEEEAVNITIVPFAAGPHRAMGTAFTVMQFSDPAFSDLLYLEDSVGDTVSRDDEEQVQRFQNIYNELHERGAAYGPATKQIEAARRRLHEDEKNQPSVEA